jgi:type IV pilus assembly protein PilA
MLQRIRNRKGFTLVELMIVVAIIGILAAIAIPNFLQFRLKAKTSEAKSNLGAIRSTEVAYFAEWNFYVGGSGENPGTGTLDGAKRAWNGATSFSIIGFAPEGNVYYSYAIEAGGDATTVYGAQANGFSGRATGDLDDDGSDAYFLTTAAGGELVKSGGDY